MNVSDYFEQLRNERSEEAYNDALNDERLQDITPRRGTAGLRQKQVMRSCQIAEEYYIPVREYCCSHPNEWTIKRFAEEALSEKLARLQAKEEASKK